MKCLYFFDLTQLRALGRKWEKNRWFWSMSTPILFLRFPSIISKMAVLKLQSTIESTCHVCCSMYYVVSGFAIVTDYKFMHGILGIPSDELWIELTLLGCNKIYPFAHWHATFISTLGCRGPPFTGQEGVGKFWRSNYMQFSKGSYQNGISPPKDLITPLLPTKLNAFLITYSKSLE